MIGVVIAAHGDLAEAMMETAQSVVRHSAPARAVGITNDDDSARYEARLRDAIAEVRGEEGVIVLTDMFGGTPSNVGLTMHEPGAVEVLTGANLPMLVKALQIARRGDADLESIATQVKASGRQAIAVASEVLAGGTTNQKEETP